MLEHTIYSVISPEGYASILWKDAGRSKDAAETFKITAQDVFQLGVVDGIVSEPPGGAHRDPGAAAENLGLAISKNLDELLLEEPEILIKSRYEKFRAIGRMNFT
ncbi:MAG: Acetyl-coenzyme A carboxylase carboxyl transferase subunit alpha [Firmicutes bacterium ADurb.Bin456]|nr:MAG: Acetyl-coenzyme A carboxylase carboxyl transferase subunit alpha [Firmicutes bacterium ADurb.Bin456]